MQNPAFEINVFILAMCLLWGMVFARDCFDMFSDKIPVVRPNSKYFWNGSTNID